MKILPVVFCAIILLASCRNQKNTDPKVAETSAATADVKGVTSEADEKNKKIDALKKMTPLTLEQLTSFLPETINGMKKSNYNADATVGYSFVSADYKKNEKSRLQVKFYDCSGEAGSAFFADSYLGELNVQQDNENEYTRTIDYNGSPAIENYFKKKNESTITYLTNDRVLVVLKGRNMDPLEVKEAAKNLTVKI